MSISKYAPEVFFRSAEKARSLQKYLVGSTVVSTLVAGYELISGGNDTIMHVAGAIALGGALGAVNLRVGATAAEIRGIELENPQYEPAGKV